MFIVLSGVSSCGKNTVINELIKYRDDIKVLEQSSCTTRTPRESDKTFNTYVFVNEDEFKKGIEEGKFFEYEIVHGNYYGTIKSQLEKAKQDKKNFYIRDVEVKGTVNLRKFFDDDEMYSIFLDAPNEELRKRLKGRGETDEEIEKRLSRSDLERSYMGNYDLVIENINLQETVNKILQFIDSKKV